MKNIPYHVERQEQAVVTLKIALERCIQEGLSTMDIIQNIRLWVMMKKGVKDVQH